MSNKMNTGTIGVRIVGFTCVVTLGLTASMITLAIMIFIDTTNCGALSRALPVLCGAIAALFIASTVVVRNIAWTVIPDIAGRRGLVVVYAAAMLVSFVVIAFGLMVAFNC